MIASILASAAGLALLAAAADQLVKGAGRLALMLGRSPVIVGTVIIGLGTSSPELFISGLSASRGSLDIAVGNVLGSNIANLSLVLGIAALITVVPATTSKLRREIPISAAAVFLFALLVQDGLTRLEGIIFLGALIAALAWLIVHAHEDEANLPHQEYLEGGADHGLGGEVIRTLAGLAGTLIGAQFLIWGAQRLAEDLGISEGVIGLTVVAIGTSFPELVTSIQAARRHETDLIAGMLLGSNLFNSLAVAGVAALVGPGSLTDPSIAGVTTLVMIGVTVLAYGTMITRRAVGRLEGAILVAVYLVALPLVFLG